MIRRLLPIVLAAALAAEDAAAPPPAPAPEQPAAGETPPAAGPATAQPLHQVRGARVARVANAAAWEANARLSAGYDSNALLESNPDKSSASTMVYSGEAGLSWRPIADDSRFLKTGVVAGYDSRPNLIDLDTARLGVNAAGAKQLQTTALSASLSGTRYWVGSQGAAAEVRAGSALAWLHKDSADLLTAEAAAIHYDRAGEQPHALPALSGLGSADDRSGVLIAAGYRHWWLFRERTCKVEAGARAGRYLADADTETYTLVQPYAAARLRLGLYEFQARAGLSWQAYAGSTPGHDPERSTTLSGLLSADRRIESLRGLSAGLYGAAATRDSSLPDRGYDRWQAGLRLSYTFSPEE